MRTIAKMDDLRINVCFIFIVSAKGTKRVICLPGCPPCFQYLYDGKNVDDMAIDCLNTHGLLNPRSSRPILSLSESPYLKFTKEFSSVYLVNLDPDALVPSSSSFGIRKLYSLVDSNGETMSGKDITLHDFSRKDYKKLFESIRHECSASVTLGGGSAARASGGESAARASGGYSAARRTGGDSAERASGGYSAARRTGGDSAERASGGDSAERASGGGSAARASGGYSAARRTGGGSAERASGGGSAVHSPHSSRLTEVSSMGSVSHVFVMLLLQCGRVLLVMGRDHTWGFPGGNVDATDASSWKAMKREFREETKNSLPSLCGRSLGSSTDEPRKFHWYHPRSRTTSGFYCGQSSTATFEDLSANFRRTHEIRDIAAVPVEVLFDMVNGTNPNRLRDCAIKSTRALLLAQGFRP